MTEKKALVPTIKDMVEALLDEEGDQIEEAMALAEDAKVSVGISVKIRLDDAGTHLETGLRLVKQKIQAKKKWLLAPGPTLPGM